MHCYNDRTVPDALDAATIDRVLGEAADLGCLFVVLTGGEVYARRDLETIVASARRRGFDVRFQTSGWELDARAASFLADQAVSEVHVSIYSAEPLVHDAVTRVTGSHARALAAVRALRTAGIRVLLKNVLTTLNAADYRGVARLAVELGCAHTTDATIVPRESGGHCGPCRFRVPDSVLEEFYGRFAWDLVSAPYRDPPPPGGYRPLDWSPCMVGTSALFLASDGTVYPCVDLKIACGNVFRDSLAWIWREAPGLANVRKLRWRDLPVCSRCAVRSYCNHCIAVAQNEHGDLLGPALENCRHALLRRDLLRGAGLVDSAETDVPPPLAGAVASYRPAR